MKKIIFSFIILLFAAHAGYAERVPYPSPYFIHDTETYFWEVYSKAMSQDYIAKGGTFGQFTPWSYVADLFFEGTFGLDRRIAEMPLSQARREQNILTWMTGLMFNSHSDRNPDNTFPDDSQFLAMCPFAGLSLYTGRFTLRMGYVYGMYGLEKDVWEEKTKSYQAAIMNYPTQAWWYNGSGSVMNRLIEDGSTYQRVYVDMEGEFSWIVLKLLGSTGVKEIEEPAFTYFSSTFKLARARYHLTPYIANTNDIEGDRSFGMTQYGLEQRYVFDGGRSSGSHSPRSYVKANVNYTVSALEKYRDSDLDNYYFECEGTFAFFGASVWYNREIGVGAGGGLLWYVPGVADLFIKGKYNPYAASPVYKRAVFEKGWSIELGFTANLYAVFGPLWW